MPTPRTRLLGVDFGTVRIGLAISDPDHKVASPLETLSRRNPESDAAFFRALIEREAVGGIVLGLPVHLDGRMSPKAKEAIEFGSWLGGATGLPVRYADERFTSVEAEASLWKSGLTHRKRKERRDRVAAQMLLQGYLDAGCPDASTIGSLASGLTRPAEEID